MKLLRPVTLTKDNDISPLWRCLGDERHIHVRILSPDSTFNEKETSQYSAANSPAVVFQEWQCSFKGGNNPL